MISHYLLIIAITMAIVHANWTQLNPTVPCEPFNDILVTPSNTAVAIANGQLLYSSNLTTWEPVQNYLDTYGQPLQILQWIDTVVLITCVCNAVTQSNDL